MCVVADRDRQRWHCLGRTVDEGSAALDDAPWCREHLCTSLARSERPDLHGREAASAVGQLRTASAALSGRLLYDAVLVDHPHLQVQRAEAAVVADVAALAVAWVADADECPLEVGTEVLVDRDSAAVDTRRGLARLQVGGRGSCRDRASHDRRSGEHK